MEWATGFIDEIYLYLNYRDDTGIDRLNRLYTVAFLSACVTLISSQQYVLGGRIHCWTLTDFSDAQVKYAQNICWLGHTNYYVPENFTRLESPSAVRKYPFVIYPWLPIILIFMTVCFAAPYLFIWHGLSTRSGINIRRLIKLEDQKGLSRAIHGIFWRTDSTKKHGRFYLMSTYFLMKILYIINLIWQIIFLNKLLMENSVFYSIAQLFKILSVKYNMWSSALLPIETMCDFMVRMLGENNNWYTVQCILPFNLFTKRIFALLILWFTFLLILNIIELIYVWFWRRLCSKVNRHNYIDNLYYSYKTYLCGSDYDDREILLDNQYRRYGTEFIDTYLGLDGYLLLTVLNMHFSNKHMSHVVMNLFKQFIQSGGARLELIEIKNVNDIESYVQTTS